MLLNSVGTQWKHPLEMADMSIGNTSSPSSSSKEDASTTFSGQRLGPAPDLQHHKKDQELMTYKYVSEIRILQIT